MRAALLLGLAACGGSSPPTAAPVRNRMEPAPRDTPPPTVVVQNDRPVQVDRLPAVARGGEVAVMAVTDSAGGAMPGLHVEVRDRSDKLVDTILITEPVTDDAGVAPSPALAQRIADANHDLAVLHGLHDLVPMKPLEVQPPPDDGFKHLAIGDGLEVDWSERDSRLKVFTHNAPRPFVTVNGTSWRAPMQKSDATGAGCSNPALLEAAYHVEPIRLIVVEIGYHGTDSCWEPSAQWHVVSW